MQHGLGMSALGAGLVQAPAATAFFVFSMVASRTVPKYGRRVLETPAVVLSSGCPATGLLLFAGPGSLRCRRLPPSFCKAPPADWSSHRRSAPC